MIKRVLVYTYISEIVFDRWTTDAVAHEGEALGGGGGARGIVQIAGSGVREDEEEEVEADCSRLTI
jgi:hypothetical protein